jgi:hypothetical protein
MVLRGVERSKVKKIEADGGGFCERNERFDMRGLLIL